jgi:hypothetical protein
MQPQAINGVQKIRGPGGKKGQRCKDESDILMDNSEIWRYTGPFTRWNRFKGAFPGFGIAAVAFTGYVIYESLFLKDSHGHVQGDSHGGAVPK